MLDPDDPQAALYVAGMLTDEEAKAIEERAAADAELAATIRLMQAVAGQHGNTSPAPTPSGGITDSQKRWRPFRNRQLWSIAFGAAVILIFCIGAVSYAQMS